MPRPASGWARRSGCSIGTGTPGRGDTPFIEVVPREHPHAVRAKSGYRRVYVSDELDRLYGEYVWRLCEAGANPVTDDFDAGYVFVNLDREPRFAPVAPGVGL